MSDMPKTEAAWREKLSPERYKMLRQAGTERAFTGSYWDTKTRGVYRCAGCGEELFSSDTKYDSQSGWPSFHTPIDPDVIEAEEDRSFGTIRTEVKCAKCGGHLGHLFDDGPNPTGLRYCINSASLDLESETDEA